MTKNKSNKESKSETKNTSLNISEEVKKSTNLFKFLQALIKLRMKPNRSVDQYENVVWLGDIPSSKNCYIQPMLHRTDVKVEEELQEKWIEIKKPKLSEAPSIPETLEDWVSYETLNDPFISTFPPLNETIEKIESNEIDNDENVNRKIIQLNENLHLKKIYKSYVSNQWETWAKKERINRKVQEIYSQLYKIYSNQKKLGETFEVLLGVGYLTWKTPSNYEVKRHGITANISINFDSTRGVITIMPSGVNGFTYFEQDMLDYIEKVRGKEEEEIKNKTNDLKYRVWGSKIVHKLLTSWVNYLSPEGEYSNKLIRHREIKNYPVISFAPAIILRKRGHRNYLNFIEKVLENIKENTNQSELIKKIISPAKKSIGKELNVENYNENKMFNNGQIYCPLPANDQQLKILHELDKKSGILVEGPPGTGKSHTIANISTHLLATGKKVLITSQGVRALKVLKDKFTKEIQSLCINVLGDDYNANTTLQESVEDINNRESLWDHEREKIKNEKLKSDLKELKKQEASVLNDLVAIREQETRKHDKIFENYSGTLAEIAQVISKEKSKYGWLHLNEDNNAASTITVNELNGLLELKRKYPNKEIAELKKSLVKIEKILTPEEFYSKSQDEKSNIEKIETLKNKIQTTNKVKFIKNRKDAEDYHYSLNKIINNVEILEKNSENWIHKALMDIFQGSSHVWESLMNQTSDKIEKAKKYNEEIKNIHITGLEKQNHEKLQSDVQSLINHIKLGKGFGFGFLKPKIIKDTQYFWSKILVDGKMPKDEKTLNILLSAVKLTTTLKKINNDWKFVEQTIPVNEAMQMAHFEGLNKILNSLMDFNLNLINLKKSIINKKTDDQISIKNKDDIKNYFFLVEKYIANEDQKNISDIFNDITSTLKQIIDKKNHHEIITKLLESALHRNTEDYQKYYSELLALKDKQEEIVTLDELELKIQKGMPNQYDEFQNTFHQNQWEMRFSSFYEASCWSKANCWLERLSNPREYENLEEKHKQILKEKKEVIEELAAKKAWSHFFGPNGIQPHQMESLKAWAKIIASIGKGTGKYAARKTRTAKEKMQDCREAIPCWIMPLYRVVENFQPGKDMFDVVIIDEASQSGPEAIILFCLAKKIIIVGDDKQIAPENIRTKQDSLDEIRDKYITDIPHNEIFSDRERSLFDLAEVRIGGRIRLREHFRCVPEIIQYCNNRYYKKESLIPLRQFGSDRLTPIKTVHVKEGYREGERYYISNEPEADRIVKKITECIHDEKYKNKTFGIISLQGLNQAKLIEQKLLTSIGPEKIEEYDIRCGDASSFQGDERNVILLSMVAAPNTSIGPLTSAKHGRRFNVAVSRAQDQLWLFHSVQLADLNAECERAKLLSYCLNPQIENHDLNYKVSSDVLVKPFESLFQQRVYLKIIEKGYRVIPEYETYGRRIDLVVEGKKERLAVECDGDYWHGPEQYLSDVQRQRDLERCGWVFWRIRESSFYRNKEEALLNLWKSLEERGIFPIRNMPDKINNLKLKKIA